MKRCSKCEATKPLSEFYRNKSYPDGRGHYCKECVNLDNKKRRSNWTPERREQQLKWQREWHARNPRDYMAVNASRHGLTLEEYLQMLEDQDFACGACGKPLGESTDVCIDHDHRHCPGGVGCQECVRGVLCNACNRALGQVQDDLDRLIGLYDYLMAGRLKVYGDCLDPQHRTEAILW